jgi:diaminopimelate epimerase
MNSLPFEKWHGAGNDFVIGDARHGAPWHDVLDRGSEAMSQVSMAVCDRHFGIGADGLVLATDDTNCLVEDAQVADVEVAGIGMRMWNPDGTESEMCGNGLRCLAAWLRVSGTLAPGTHYLGTGAGPLAVHLHVDGCVSVAMGRPRLAGPLVPVVGATTDSLGRTMVSLPGWLGHDVAPGRGKAVQATCVAMPNPHAVIFLAPGDRVRDVPLDTFGPMIERHDAFPRRTNVEVCEVVDRSTIAVRVWERGTGATLACGTGACAVIVAARLHGLVDPRAEIQLAGGTLVAQWHGAPGDTDHEVTLTGPTVRTFAGMWFRK